MWRLCPSQPFSTPARCCLRCLPVTFKTCVLALRSLEPIITKSNPHHAAHPPCLLLLPIDLLQNSDYSNGSSDAQQDILAGSVFW